MTATSELQQARRSLTLDEARTKNLTSKNNGQQRVKPGISTTSAPRLATARAIDTDVNNGAGTKTIPPRPTLAPRPLAPKPLPPKPLGPRPLAPRPPVPLTPVSNTKVQRPNQVVETTNAENAQPVKHASRPKDKEVIDRYCRVKPSNGAESETCRQRCTMSECSPNEVVCSKVKRPLQGLPSPSGTNQEPTSSVTQKKRRLSDNAPLGDRKRVRSRPLSPTTPAQEARVVLQDLSEQLSSKLDNAQVQEIRKQDPNGPLDQSVKMLVRCRRCLVKLVNESGQHEQKIEALENDLADAHIASDTANVLAKQQHRTLVEQKTCQEAKIAALESAAAANDSLVREVEDLRRDFASQESIVEQKATIKKYEETAQYCDRACARLQLDISKLEKESNEVKSRNESLMMENQALNAAKAAVSSLEQDKAEWADLKERMENDVKAKERVIAVKDAKLLDLRQQIAKLRHSISSFRGQANLSQRRLRELGNARTNLRRNEAARIKQKEEHDVVLAELGQKIEELASKLRTAVHEKQKLAEHTDQVLKQHERQIQLKDEDRLTAIETVTAHLRSEFETTLQERLSRRDEHWKKSVDALTRSKEELQSAMDRAKEEITRLVEANVELQDKQRPAGLARDALAVVVQRNCQVIASKDQQIVKLIEEKYGFEEQLEAAQVEIRALKRDNALQASTTNAATIKLAAVELERDRSRQANEEKQTQLAGLQVQFSEQSEAFVALQKSLFNERHSRKCDVHQLNEKLQAKDGEVQMLQKLLRKNEEDGRKVIQGLQTTTNQLTETLQARDHTIARLQSQLQGAPSPTTTSLQAMQLQCLLKERDVTISELESKLRSASSVDAEKQIEEARKQVQKSAAELTCTAAKVLHLRSQLAVGEDELKHVKQQLADTQRQETESMNIKSELESQLSTASTECEHYRKRLIELTDYSEKLSKRHEDCEKELGRVSLELKRVRAENSFLDRRLEEGDMAVSKLEKELSDEKKCTEELKRLSITSKPVIVDASTQVTTSPASKPSKRTVACQTEALKPKIKTSLPPVTGVSQLPTPAGSWTPQGSVSSLDRRDSSVSVQSARAFNPPLGPKRWSAEERASGERYRPAKGDRRHQNFCRLEHDHDGPCNGSPDPGRGRWRNDDIGVRRRSRSPYRRASEGRGSAYDRRTHDVYRP